MSNLQKRALLAFVLAVNLLVTAWAFWTFDKKGSDCSARYKEASPYYSISSKSAPAAIYNSANEAIPESQARLYADRLRAAGVTERLTIIPGTRHAEAYERVVLRSG